VPVGGKASGGILDQVLREVEIECLPGDIPSHIDVDVSNLALFESLRVGDLPHSDKIKYLNAEDATVAHVISIREEVAPVAEVDAAAAAAAATTTAEPEVAKKGKPEDAAKAADAGAKKPAAKK
jgi:large subunit ribosomal protein L25